MNPILSAGILIGLLCAIWTFVMGFTGWYKDPVMANAFFVVILIEVGGLIWGLKKTAAGGKRYLAQLGAGTLMSLVAGLIVIVSSLLFTVVVFPNYFEELRAMQEQMLQQAGRSPEEIQQALALAASTQTPAVQAIAGFVGTLITGFVATLIIAAFIRSRR
jgi:hypothetical protein